MIWILLIVLVLLLVSGAARGLESEWRDRQAGCKPRRRWDD